MLRSTVRRSILPGVLGLVLVIGLFTLLAASLAAQGVDETQAPHTPTITVNARLVVLDVVVTGKDGKPVDGLTRKDFQIFEDDKPQSIRSFESPSAHILPAEQGTTDAAIVFDPAKPASFGQSPVTILVLDELNTHFADSSFARRELRDFLLKQPPVLSHPATLLSVYDNNFKSLQGFTRDRNALLHSLEAEPTKYAWKLEEDGKADHGPIERLDQSLRALDQIAQSYARIPGRKNLIWVGGGFPTVDMTTLDSVDAKEVKDTLQHVTNVLLDTRVTMYAVDPSSSAMGMTEIVDATQMAFASAAGDALSGALDPFGGNDDFDNLGPVTGGRVVRGMNNVASQIADSIDLGANYYTIGYAPTSSSQAESKYRKIRVECLVPGLKATTRSGYYAESPHPEKSTDTMAYDLTTAAESNIPLNGLHVTVEADHSVAAEEESYIVHVGASELMWKTGDDGASSASVAVMAVSLSSKGKMLGHVLHGMTANARAGVDLRDSTKSANFSITVKLVPKATTLRFIVRDSATGRMGSVDLPMSASKGH